MTRVLVGAVTLFLSVTFGGSGGGAVLVSPASSWDGGSGQIGCFHLDMRTSSNGRRDFVALA